MSPAIHLYGLLAAPFTDKVVRGLRLKGLAFEVHEPQAPEDYRRWNPETGLLPLVEIDGSGAGGFQHGLTINAGGSTVRGLAINRCNGSGIQLFTGDGNTIEDNYLGTNVAGTAALPNGYGVNTNGSDGNLIQRNLISGNGTGILLFGTGNTVRGNFVGTDVTGTANLAGDAEMCMPGDNARLTVELMKPIAMDDGVRFAIREGGKTVGSGVVTKIVE